MDTRKLKNFEYAGFVDPGLSEELKIHQKANFTTPNGYAMIVASYEPAHKEEQDRAAVVVERVKYYLNNEVLDDPRQAVHNALLYANGFLFEQHHRESNSDLRPVSCLLVLVQNQKAYYSWAGRVCMYLFAAKKWIPLAGSNASTVEHDADQAIPPRGAGNFLGVQKMISPGLCETPLQAVDNDMLVMGTDPVCEFLREKDARKVLLDSMPVQTKVMRLINIINGFGNQAAVALQLVSFYNLDARERSFSQLDDLTPPPAAVLPRFNKILKTDGKLNLYKIAAVIIGLLAVGYMVYDLFLFQPLPSTRITTNAPARNNQQDTLQVEENQESGVTFPEDEVYTVKSGDTWVRVYQQFEVCSWFIINHAPNAHHFKESNDLVSGTILSIPVKYSAKASLNPDYYNEFTTDKLGTSCQNAGEAYINQFEEKVNP